MTRITGSIAAIILCLVAIPGWAQPITGGAADLAKQIQALETLVKRLHGYKAAVLAHDFETASEGPPGQMQIGIAMCPGLGDHVGGIGGGLCTPQSAGAATLQTRFLTDVDDRAILTFTAENSTDFAAMVDLLSNGSDDRIRLTAEYFDEQGNFLMGNGRQVSERIGLFIGPQVSSGPGYIDLAGFDLDNITVSIDRLVMVYDEDDDETDFSLSFRVFFGLAE
jgi:hypothetical protein